MEERIRNLVVDNLKQKLSKDQVMKILEEESISIRAYNDFILKTLSSSGRPLSMKPSKTLNIDTFLGDNCLKNILNTRRKTDEAYSDKRTLFEERDIPTKYYSGSKYSSCRLMNKILTTDEIFMKFRDYAEELGMSKNIGRECAEYLGRGLELYVKNLVGDCNGKITIPNLKKNLGKHLRLFNSLDMF